MQFHYITEYETCALAFLIVVTIRFFGMRKFPSRLNRMFGVILHLAIIDLTLDIVGSYTIEGAAYVAPWINYVVNTLFYSLQVLFPAVLLLYTLFMCGCEGAKKIALLFIPVLLSEIMLLINPFTDIIFYLKDTPAGLVYTRGNLFNVLYVISVYYMSATVFFVHKYRARLRRVEAVTILSFTLMIVVAMVLQFFFRDVLLTGVAMSLAILMMFFTIQNPESMLDMITGVFNYSALTEYLRVQVKEKRGILLTAVDVGGIRRINGAMGVRVGNDLLEQIGGFFNSLCNNRVMVFRMIGTRFLFISSGSEASEIAMRVSERFERPWLHGSQNVMLIVTIRYCLEAYHFSSPEDAINLIDSAYATIADDGYGTTKPIGKALLAQSRRRTQVEEAVREAMRRGAGFSLHFQPLYAVKEQRFTGAEALLRLTDPVLGSISPAEFIPVAENAGLIHAIDLMVFDMVCAFLDRYPALKDAGLTRLEVNLSANEFGGDADELASDILQRIAGKENRICIEVTETAATAHREVLSSFMDTLITRGVRFALDDFGTGYANMAQLSELPFSAAKLDRFFIVSERQKGRILLEDLIAMFDRLGLDTVVEGVETAQQAELAAELGADMIQGFFYTHPLPEEAFVEHMLSRAGRPAASSSN